MDTIIPYNFEKNVDIKKRAFDGVFNVWHRIVEWGNDGTYSIIWQVVGTSPDLEGALAIKQELKKRVAR